MNKFNIGDKVYNTIKRRGSYEPSIVRPYTELEVISVSKHGDTYQYVCDEYDGYIFLENELLSAKEYAEKILSD